MIKKSIILSFIILLFISCGDDRTRLFEMKLEADFTMASGTNTIETFYYDIPNVNTFYSTYSGNINESSIGSINSFSCNIDGKFGVIDYNFIEEIYIYGIDPGNTADRHELFYLEFNPLNNENDLELFASLNDFKDLLMNDLMHLEVRIRYRNSINTSLDNRITMTFYAFEEE